MCFYVIIKCANFSFSFLTSKRLVKKAKLSKAFPHFVFYNHTMEKNGKGKKREITHIFLFGN